MKVIKKDKDTRKKVCSSCNVVNGFRLAKINGKRCWICLYCGEKHKIEGK